MIASWDIDLSTFNLEVVLNRKIVQAGSKKFEFVETGTSGNPDEEPGLLEFLKDRSLSGDMTQTEIEFLRRLHFRNGEQPTALYYYRELQNLRDPLHFREVRRGH